MRGAGAKLGDLCQFSSFLIILIGSWLRNCNCDIMRQDMWRYAWEICCDIMRQDMWRYAWEKLRHYALAVTLCVGALTYNVTLCDIMRWCDIMRRCDIIGRNRPYHLWGWCGLLFFHPCCKPLDDSFYLHRSRYFLLFINYEQFAHSPPSGTLYIVIIPV